MFTTASMIIAARVATGRYESTGVNNKSVIQTMTQVTTDVRPVFAPALRFTAVLLRLQATQYQPKRLDTIFAIH